MGHLLSKRCCSSDDGFNVPQHLRQRKKSKPITTDHQVQFLFVNDSLTESNEGNVGVQYQQLCGMENYLRQRRKSMLKQKQKDSASLSTSYKALLDQTIETMLVEEESTAEGEYALLQNPTEDHFCTERGNKKDSQTCFHVSKIERINSIHKSMEKHMSFIKDLDEDTCCVARVNQLDRPPSGQSDSSGILKQEDQKYSSYRPLTEDEDSIVDEHIHSPTDTNSEYFLSPVHSDAEVLSEKSGHSSSHKSTMPRLFSEKETTCKVQKIPITVRTPLIDGKSTSSSDSETEEVHVVHNFSQCNIVESVIQERHSTKQSKPSFIYETKSESSATSSVTDENNKELIRKGSGLKQALDEYAETHGDLEVKEPKGLSHSRTHRKNLSNLDMDSFVSLCQDPYQVCSSHEQVGILLEEMGEEKLSPQQPRESFRVDAASPVRYADQSTVSTVQLISS